MKRLIKAGLPAACTLVGAGVAATAFASGNGKVATVPYVTKDGDSLYAVSDRYLQGPQDWHKVAHLNTVREPRALPPGKVLNLPVARLRKERLDAHVIALHGPVDRAASGADAAFAPVTLNAVLSEGDKLRTGDGGFVTLELADGTHLSLPPNSQIDLATLRRTVLTGTLDREIMLQRGSVDSDVTHMKQADDRFQVKSPSVVAGVRGTHFHVDFDKQAATRIEVLDGTVGVNTKQQSMASATLVHKDHGSVTQEGGQVGDPVELLAPPELADPAKVQDGQQVVFNVLPEVGAKAYLVRLAHDAGFIDTFARARVDDPHAVFDQLPDGNYFVRIAAFDASGLQGQPRTYTFERRQFGLSTSAGPSANGYQFRWAATGSGGATSYRFVLSTAKDLSHPVLDQSGVEGGQISVAALPPGDYYWSVVAEQYEHGRFYEKASPVNSFTLAR